MATTDLKKRVAALEAKLGKLQPAPKRSDRPSLTAEIDELERSLNAMYMDDDDEDDFDNFDEDDIVFDEGAEPGCGGPVGMGSEFGMGEELDYDDDYGDDDGYDDDDEDGLVPLAASEVAPGIEDEITQDYLNEVEEEEHGTELATGDSMLDVAPTRRSASEYVAKLNKASTRLDRVASYLERQGRIELASRIDKIADAIDARAKKATRRA